MSFSHTFSAWIDRVSGTVPREVVLEPDEFQPLSAGAVRVGLDQAPLGLRLSDTELHLWLEAPLIAESLGGEQSLLIADPRRMDDGIYPLVRLAPGERFEIDPGDETQRVLFACPERAFRHRLQIRYDGSGVTFKERITDREASVFRLPPDRAVGMDGTSQVAMRRVLEACSGPARLLEPDEALHAIHDVNALLAADPYLKQGNEGGAGAILRLPGHITPVLLGDLHGHIENLLSALSRNAFFDGIASGEAALILLGDVVHPEDGELLDDMSGSMMAMDMFFMLKRRFPHGVHMILGNHDSFSPELSKGGVLQGPAWERALLATRGVAYRDAMREFYSRVPLLATSADFAACHAGPPRSAIDSNTLAVIRSRPDLVHEITWNRPAGRGRPAGYTSRDVNRFRAALGLPGRFLVTAHHPRTLGGTVWTDVEKVKGHHVVYSARPDRVGVVTRVAGEMVPLTYPVEPLSSFTQGLQAKV